MAMNDLFPYLYEIIKPFQVNRKTVEIKSKAELSNIILLLDN